MKHPKPFRSALAALAAMALMPVAAQALPIITSIVQTGGDDNANTPAQFTGQTYNHPNLGANYKVPPFGDEVAAFRDRVHQWTAATPPTAAVPVLLPKYLVGGELIQIRNDNRDNAAFTLDVTLSQPAMVYLLIDNRRGDGAGGDPPDLTTGMTWVLEQGFEPVITGLNRAQDPSYPDEIGVDEGGDGAGSGQGVNQWSSVYGKFFQAGTVNLFQPDNSGRNMYGVVVKAVATNPLFVGGTGNLLGFRFEIEEGTQTKLNTSSVTVKLDGAPVTMDGAPVLTDGFWAFTKTLPSWLPSASSHTVEVTFSDNANPANTKTNTFTFVADTYATLGTAQSVPASSVDTASSGFTARIAQFRDSALWPGNDLPNNTRRAEDQLAGRLIDVLTGQPLQNFAVAGPLAGGAYNPTMINFNQQTSLGLPDQTGSFTDLSTPSRPDEAIPGIPGTEPDLLNPPTDNIAGEFIGYLQLSAGLHLLGVNSDDGFRVTAGKDPRSPQAPELGVFSGGRGVTDSLFYVEVTEAGIYPVRLVWYEGGGGAAVEFFSQNISTGAKTLINDRENGGIVSYSKATTSQLSASVSPLNNATGVSPSAPIQAQIFEEGTTLAPASVVLTVNGQAVTPQVSKTGTISTVYYAPTALLPAGVNNVTLTFSDTAAPARNYSHSWSFTVDNAATFAVIPQNFSVPSSSLDLTSSGFLADAYIMTIDGISPVARTGFSNNNSVEAAEHQANRRFIDEGTGQPYANLIPAGTEAAGRYLVEQINISQTGTDQSTFTSANGNPENPIPGLDFSDYNWVTVEFLTYLELKAGHHQFIVNCDDGFLLTTAPNPDSTAGAVQLGIRSPGGGATDVFVNVLVEKDGFYPIRLLWWEGTGGANCEFTYVNPNTGARVLVNDRTKAGTVKAYPKYTGPVREAPTVAITAPLADAKITPAGQNITVTANATATGGTVSKVEFFESGTKIGEATASPFSVNWSSVPEGRYVLTATVTDSNGFVGRSTPIHILVGTPLVSINFQTAASETPEGFLPDTGLVFGDQGNGFSYGWDADNSANARDRNSANSPNQWYDTLTHSQRPPAGTVWEIALPNGAYKVYGVAGDPDNFDSVYDVLAEGVSFIKGTPTSAQRFIAGTATVSVTDGKLTITNGPTASNNKIAFIDVFTATIVEQPRITGISRSGGSVTITWTGGGTLQSNTDLGNLTGWIPVGTGGSVTEQATAPHKFYRVSR